MHNFFNLNVTNLARGGRSTRSFINEGLWAALLERIVPSEGTFVLIEMGHNDDGDPTTDVDDRATLRGIGNESVVVASNITGGAPETVYTFGYYLRKMTRDVREAGGVPLLSGMVPRMYWTGDVLQHDWPFADYVREVAEEEGVEYIDHTKYAVNRWQGFGSDNATRPYYPLDHTHTSWPGAESKSHIENIKMKSLTTAIVNIEALVTAVKCGHSDGNKPSQLARYLNTNATTINYPC
ncbi:rhamnogalacturonan acetylesterase [Aspergillus udagawae]|uniref:Rhamnogalacturonan acetylesterase n=1 Tax=Aspergillus udagawae TaxID=91492 RepID=A0A8H3SF10_9EURO|nr:rhamnogalacturonan acetylesterase [Aspergillus udagawae]